ncbi:MAG: carbohydrate kinase family protein [Phycisphaeraceae bacterium]|nr:carbohydrate kinase family protein [Phycisphaeraceae bacterium]
MTTTLDCIVAGSCVVDLLCRQVNLDVPVGPGRLHEVEPLQVTGGGIVSNSGVAMARLGARVGAFSYVGHDDWAPVIRNIYAREGMDTSLLLEHPTGATSTTVVMIAPDGERAFLHCVGAPKLMNRDVCMKHIEELAKARCFLIGYYSLMPNLEGDLPLVLAELQRRGVMTAMDAAGSGGTMQPLDRMLSHLDVYFPSYDEAVHQTGEKEPRTIIARYRECGAHGILGVKLGKRGVIVSPDKDTFIEVPISTPPGPVVDTTGAGDTCFGGFLVGLLRGLSPKDAAKIGTAAAACCVTAMGGCNGVRDWDFTARLAGLK